MTRNLIIRSETASDYAAIQAIHQAAFKRRQEGELVDKLREQVTPFLSIVAEKDAAIVGHIALSPVELEGHPQLNAVAIGPMAVEPGQQKKGIGSALLDGALREAFNLRINAVFVLGHPEYYSRFGFVPASRFGITCEFEVPDEVFMALELQPRVLQNRAGRLTYHAAFAELS